MGFAERSPELIVGGMAEESQIAASPKWLVRAALCLACLLTISSALVAPWQQVHPSDPSLRVSLGYAPIWSSRFADIPGAHIDVASAVINILVVWVLFIAVMIVTTAMKPAE